MDVSTAFKKVMRIGAKDASMGGEASNADVMRTTMADDYSLESPGPAGYSASA